MPFGTAGFAAAVADKAAGSKARKVVLYGCGGGMLSWHESQRARLAVRTKPVH